MGTANVNVFASPRDIGVALTTATDTGEHTNTGAHTRTFQQALGFASYNDEEIETVGGLDGTLFKVKVAGTYNFTFKITPGNNLSQGVVFYNTSFPATYQSGTAQGSTFSANANTEHTVARNITCAANSYVWVKFGVPASGQQITTTKFQITSAGVTLDSTFATLVASTKYQLWNNGLSEVVFEQAATSSGRGAVLDPDAMIEFIHFSTEKVWVHKLGDHLGEVVVLEAA